MKKIKEIFIILCNPDVWYQQQEYDANHDRFITTLLDKPIDSLDEYHVVIGGVSLWVGNIPYSCFNLHKTFEYNYNFRPSRINILKMIDKIKEHKKQRGLDKIKELDLFIKNNS